MKERSRKISAIFLVFCLLFSVVTGSAMAAAPSDGVPEGYTAITNEAELRAIAGDMDGKYILMNDITLSADWTPLGLGDSQAREVEEFTGTAFTGVLDGNGKTITGMSCTLPSYIMVGMFAQNKGVIRNLTLKDADINGRTWVGGFAGVNSGVIENCTVTGSTVAGREGSAPAQEYNYVGGSQIGGLAGWNQSGGAISKSALLESSVHGNRYVGGIAGVNNGQISQTFVRDCTREEGNWIGSKYYKDNSAASNALKMHLNYLITLVNSGQASGTNAPYMYTGGLVGANQSNNGTGTVQNCYVTNTQINAIDAFGELIGVNWGKVVNSYSAENGLAYYNYFSNSQINWTPDYASRNLYNSGGTVTGVHYYASSSLDLRGTGTKHYSGAGMKEQATYAGWDFTGIWTLGSEAAAVNYGYPVFGVTEAGPEAPAEEELAELLEGNAVKIDCTNEAVSHADRTYGLLAGGYTAGAVQGDAQSGYTCTVTVSPAKYVEQYGEDTGAAHVLAPESQGSREIVLEYDQDAKAWRVQADTAPAVYTVVCETPAVTPEGPAEEELAELLEGNAVKIDCTNEAVSHADRTYGLLAGGYTAGAVQGDAQSGYTCTVTVSPAKYVEQYGEDTGAAHVLAPESQGSREIVLEYDQDAKAWRVQADTAPAVYTVVCETPAVTPEGPAEEEPGDPDNPEDPQPPVQTGENSPAAWSLALIGTACAAGAAALALRRRAVQR